MESSWTDSQRYDTCLAVPGVMHMSLAHHTAAPPNLPTLREILRRPLFTGARALAGEELLDVPVRWVHVGEILDVANYLHGQELILSTGVGLRRPSDGLRYLEQLAACRVAGICIELGRYVKAIPDEMLRLADRLGVALIVFPKPVRFVDITQDINALILQGEKGALEALRALGEEFQKLGGQPNAIRTVVNRLSEWLSLPVAFVQDGGSALSAGSAPEMTELLQRARELCRTMRPTRTIYPEVPLADGRAVVSRRTAVGSVSYGLLATAGSPDDRVAVGMALDLAASAIAQEMFRQASRAHQSGEGRNQALVEDLIAGKRVPARMLREEIAHLGLGEAMPAQAVVMLMRCAAGEAQESAAAQIRTWLLHEGLRACVATVDGEFVAVLFDPPPMPLMKRTVESLLSGIETHMGSMPLRLGVGRRVPISRIQKSHHEAEQALMAGFSHGFRTSPFYRELGAYRILLNLRDDFDLEAFVDDELGPLIEQDRLHGTDLLHTLCVLVSTGGGKEEAAEALAIHRQTLYNRIRRLEQLMGQDLLTPSRRLEIQLALLAHEMTSGDTP